MKPIVKFPSDYPAPLNVVGEGITVLSTKAETSGYELFIQDGAEGSGPPPHSHGWDETFYVLEGNIEFGHGEEKVTGTPGTLVHIPAGNTHWFRFLKGGGKMLSITGKNGNASKLYTEFAAAIPTGEIDMVKLGQVADRNGVTFKA